MSVIAVLAGVVGYRCGYAYGSLQRGIADEVMESHADRAIRLNEAVLIEWWKALAWSRSPGYQEEGSLEPVLSPLASISSAELITGMR